jgi:ribosomal protein S18 acetylase RimI-like enzyme
MKHETAHSRSQSSSSAEEFRLRPLNRHELPRFIELGFPTCFFLHGRDGVDKTFQKQQFTGFVTRHAFEEGSEIYVLVDGLEHIAGQLWLHVTNNLFSGLKELWIWDITVDEDYRNRGLGKKLLQYAESRASELKCKELWLLVAEYN